ncbi:MAG TPA: methyltransferase [Mycobacteriales bacterium]
MQTEAVRPADSDVTVAARKLLQMVLGYQTTAIITTVTRFGVPDLLAEGPRSATELAQATGADEGAMRRLLRAAVALEVLDKTGPDQYALTDVGILLRKDLNAMHGVASAVGKSAHTRPVEFLYDAVMECRSVVKDAIGMEIWEYWDSDPDTKAAMTEHLVEVNAQLAPVVIEKYDMTRFHRIIDVGGNQGFFLAALLEAAPQATGVLFDRPEVMAEAKQTMTAAGLADRVEFVGGNFLDEVPKGGDLYLLKGIFHDWPDESVARILDNCHRAAAPDSTLLVFEGIVRSDPPYDPLVHLMDINMLLMVNGCERTYEEFAGLLNTAGYEIGDVVPLPSMGYWPFHMIEATRR